MSLKSFLKLKTLVFFNHKKAYLSIQNIKKTKSAIICPICLTYSTYFNILIKSFETHKLP